MLVIGEKGNSNDKNIKKYYLVEKKEENVIIGIEIKQLLKIC